MTERQTCPVEATMALIIAENLRMFTIAADADADADIIIIGVSIAERRVFVDA